jgi:septation ring formation regulator EzrA
MEDRVQRFVKSLEKTIQNNYHYLKETAKDFCETCQIVSRKGSIPLQILAEVRKTNKEIQDRLKEIKAIQDLLQAKYRRFYRRDSYLDRELNGIRLLVKTAYSKFEYEFQRIQIKNKEKNPPFPGSQEHPSFQCFRSKENQVTLLRNLRILNDLDYQMPIDLGTEERREVVGNKLRSLTIFIFSGDPSSLDDIQSAMGLREHDIVERWSQDELRGVLTHLREVNSSEIEGVLQRFMESTGSLKPKCLSLFVHSGKTLDGEVLSTIRKTLQEMSPGELKTISA